MAEPLTKLIIDCPTQICQALEEKFATVSWYHERKLVECPVENCPYGNYLDGFCVSGADVEKRINFFDREYIIKSLEELSSAEETN